MCAERYSCAPVIDDENFQLGNGIEVTLTNENIEDIAADVVVIGNGGDASKSLQGKGGTAYESTLRTMTITRTQSAADNTLLSIDAGSQLKCKKVYLATVSPHSRGASAWSKHLTEIYVKASTMAVRERATAVAVVLIGAGKAGGPTKDSVRAALEAFSKLPSRGCVTRLLLVERDERRTREAVQECRQWTSEHPAPSPSERPVPARRMQAAAAEEDPEIFNSMMTNK